MNLSKNLAPLKAAALAKIDSEAGKIRCLFITDTEGQEMVYSEKRIEAEAYLADPTIDPVKIPHIVDEADLKQISVAEQAQIILDMAAQWKAVSAPIERLRLAAKKAVQTATTPAQIEAAATIDWSPIEALAI